MFATSFADSERGDRLEVQQVVGEEVETVKLKNVVPPIRFESGVAQIPPDYVEKLGADYWEALKPTGVAMS